MCCRGGIQSFWWPFILCKPLDTTHDQKFLIVCSGNYATCTFVTLSPLTLHNFSHMCTYVRMHSHTYPPQHNHSYMFINDQDADCALLQNCSMYNGEVYPVHGNSLVYTCLDVDIHCGLLRIFCAFTLWDVIPLAISHDGNSDNKLAVPSQVPEIPTYTLYTHQVDYQVGQQCLTFILVARYTYMWASLLTNGTFECNGQMPQIMSI